MKNTLHPQMDQDSEQFIPQERQSTCNEKISSQRLDSIINTAKSNLQKFIKSLDLSHDFPLNLSNYKLIDQLSSIDPNISTTTILQIYNNIIRKIMTYQKKRINWCIEDVTLLIWIVQNYKQSRKKSREQFTEVDWDLISSILPCKTSFQCMFKCFNLQKTNQNPPDWTQVEDNILKQLMEQHSKNCNWSQISEEIYMKNPGIKIFRSGKKCRQRWEFHLNPKIIKTFWEPHQDFKLLKYSYEFGKKWALISKILSIRTQNAVKNRYNYLIQKSKSKKNRKLFHSEEQFLINYMNDLKIKFNINNEQQIPTQLNSKKKRTLNLRSDRFISNTKKPNKQLQQRYISNMKQQNEKKEQELKQQILRQEIIQQQTIQNIDIMQQQSSLFRQYNDESTYNLFGPSFQEPQFILDFDNINSFSIPYDFSENQPQYDYFQ